MSSHLSPFTGDRTHLCTSFLFQPSVLIKLIETHICEMSAWLRDLITIGQNVSGQRDNGQGDHITLL